jgi:hypothetical protein
MFDRLCVRLTALRRHRIAPLLKERLDYLAFLAEQGRSVNSLRSAASYLLVITDYLRLADCPGKSIRREEIEQMAARWAKRRSSKLARWCGGRTSRASFLWRATDWLQIMDRFEEKPTPISPLDEKIAAFADVMRSERAFSPTTTYGRCQFVRRFLDRLGNADGAFKDEKPKKPWSEDKGLMTFLQTL